MKFFLYLWGEGKVFSVGGREIREDKEFREIREIKEANVVAPQPRLSLNSLNSLNSLISLIPLISCAAILHLAQNDIGYVRLAVYVALNG